MDYDLIIRAGTFGMTSAIAQAIGFPELSKRLRDEGLINTMELLLEHVFHLTAVGFSMAKRKEVLPTRALPRLAQPACFLFRM